MLQLDRPVRDFRSLLAVLVVASLAFNLLPTMVAPALPAIQRDLGATPSAVAWVLSGYLLAAAVATPVIARLGDVLGRERALLGALVLFAAGLLVAALARDLSWLLAGRMIQGTAGGAILPLAFGILRDRLPPDRLSSGIGVIAATFGVGGSAGLVVSGVVVDQLSYRWIFVVGLGLTLAAIVMVMPLVASPMGVLRGGTHLDWTGGALLGAGLGMVLVALGSANAWGWASARTLALAAAGAVVLAVWVRHELRARDPLIDLRLLPRRGLWTAGVLTFVTSFGLFGAFLLVPQFLQAPRATGYGWGASVTVAGLAMVPCALGMMAAGGVAARMTARFGVRRTLFAALIAALLGYVPLVADHDAAWKIALGTTVIGAALGTVVACASALAVGSVAAESTGEATSVTVIMRTAGGALGAQLAGAILGAHRAGESAMPSEAGYTAAFALCAVVMALGLVVVRWVPDLRPADIAVRG